MKKRQEKVREREKGRENIVQQVEKGKIDKEKNVFKCKMIVFCR